MPSQGGYFALWAINRADKLEERQRVREAHRARLREGAPGLTVVLGGPTTREDGTMAGSLIVFKADDIEKVRAFVAGDPYMLQGVYEPDSVCIRPWVWGIGRPD